ncbi:MAG: DNA-3-methyladenine glycosylase [Thermodesulfobacteriota bacterium]
MSAPSATPRFGSVPPAAFFRRPALELAPDLLGMVLAHAAPDGVAAGRIVEVEAYCGPDDLAAHSARGRRTARNEVMYGEGGVAYVYFIYGIHWCVNVVAATRDVPQAVLIRALEPLHGLDLMRARRGARVADAALARGPGNLTRALAIDRALNGADLRTSALRLYRPRNGLPDARDVVASRRIGVDYAGPWAEQPWRFSLRGSRSVSRPPRAE